MKLTGKELGELYRRQERFGSLSNLEMILLRDGIKEIADFLQLNGDQSVFHRYIMDYYKYDGYVAAREEK